MPAPDDSPRRPPDLAIFDNDQYSSFLQSPFRRVEYAAHVQAFPGTVVYSTFANRRSWRAPAEGANSDGLTPHIRPLAHAFGGAHPRLAYCVFLSNVSYFLPLFEHHRVPFCFTLYPGGGFLLDELGSDLRLLRVFASPFFRKVIVTQDLTRRYLLDRAMCRPEQIDLIWGCALPIERLAREALPRRTFPRDKPTLDIGFVAFKYCPDGADKGFDIFTGCAALLAAAVPAARFHVVGNFTAADLPTQAPRDRFTFYGPRPTSFFPSFYSAIDLVLAPTRPNVLAPGAFDGFPTGACTEAAACGVPVFCTDPLGMNRCFRSEKELVIIEPNAEAAFAAVARHCGDPERLERIGERGRAAVLRLFSAERQLAPRTRALAECVAGGPRPSPQEQYNQAWLDREVERLAQFEYQARRTAGGCARCHQIEASRGWQLVLRLRRWRQACRAAVRSA